jgi:hypothetical protein
MWSSLTDHHRPIRNTLAKQLVTTIAVFFVFVFVFAKALFESYRGVASTTTSPTAEVKERI